jgi:hypothetical protein
MAYVSKVDVVESVKGLDIDEAAAAAAIRKIRKMPALEINDLGDRARALEFDSEDAVTDPDSYMSCAMTVAVLLVNTDFAGTSQEAPPEPVAETPAETAEPVAAPVAETVGPFVVEEPVAEVAEAEKPAPSGRRTRRQARQAEAVEPEVASV